MENVKINIIIHSGKSQKQWIYDYIPNIGEEIITSIASFKVIRKSFEPENNTLRIFIKQIDIKAKETSKNTSYESQCEQLINDIKPYIEEFGKDMCNDFYAYWTEQITQGRLKGQCRYVEQKTWSIYKRLNTWKNNNFNKK